MKDIPKIIYAAIELQNAPSEQCVETVTPMSYRELSKGSRDLMKLTPFQINSLAKQQNLNLAKIEESNFMYFEFGSSRLIGIFKCVFNINNKELQPGFIHIAWNGSNLTIF